MMSVLALSMIIGFGVWLLLFPGSYIEVQRRLRSRYSSVRREPKPVVVRVIGAIWLIGLALTLLGRG